MGLISAFNIPYHGEGTQCYLLKHLLSIVPFKLYRNKKPEPREILVGTGKLRRKWGKRGGEEGVGGMSALIASFGGFQFMPFFYPLHWTPAEILSSCNNLLSCLHCFFRRSSNLFATRTGRTLLRRDQVPQIRRRSPSVDNRHRRKGQPYGQNHRQATNHRSRPTSGHSKR